MFVKVASIVIIVFTVIGLLALAVAPSMLSSKLSREEEQRQLECELEELRKKKYEEL